MFFAYRSFTHYFLSFLLMGLFATPLHAGESRRKIVLASTFYSPGSVLGTWSALVLRDAFGRLGFDYEQRYMPAKRAEMVAMRGDVDGETLRQFVYGEGRPSLLRVPTPHQWDSFSAYAVRDIALVDGWNSLTNTHLRVNIRLGATYPEMQLRERVPSGLLEISPDFSSGLRKIVTNHSDIYVELDTAIQTLIAQPEFSNKGIRRIAVMERLDGYCYLHEKNQNLLAPLSDTLASMRKDGTLERYRKQAQRMELGRSTESGH